MVKKNKLKLNLIWNTLGTTFNSFNSLFYLIIVTRINGVDDAGIFTFAFSTACLFYVIGIYSGRTYQITENNKRILDSDYYYMKIITCSIMLIVSILFCLIKGYELYKSLIIICLCIYKLLEAASEFIYAIIQKNEELYKTGISMFLKAILSLFLFFMVDLITKNLILSEIVIILVNVLIILFYDIPNLQKMNFKIKKFNRDNTIDLLKKGFSTFGFTFLTLYVINASKYAIDGVLSDNLQTIFGIVIMPATILILFGQFIIQPFLTMLKKSLETNKKQFISIIIKMSLAIFIIGLLILLAAYLLGIPLLELLYGIDLDKYHGHLMIIIVGAIFYAITNVFQTALTTMRCTFIQLIIFIVVSVFTLILSNYLVINYSILGASLSYTITMFILLILYVITFIINVKGRVTND